MREMLSKSLCRVERSERLRQCYYQTHKFVNPCIQSQRRKISSQKQEDKNRFKRVLRFFFGQEACPPDTTQTSIKDDNIIQLLQFEPPKAKFIKEPHNQRCGRIIQQIFGQEENEKGPFDYHSPLEANVSIDTQGSNREKIVHDILTSTSDLPPQKKEAPVFDNSLITLQCSSSDKMGGDKKGGEKFSNKSKGTVFTENKLDPEKKDHEKLVLRIKNEKVEDKLNKTANIKEVPTTEQHVEEFNTVPKIHGSPINIQLNSSFVRPRSNIRVSEFAPSNIKPPGNTNEVYEAAMKKLSADVASAAIKTLPGLEESKNLDTVNKSIIVKDKPVLGEYTRPDITKPVSAGPEACPGAVIFPINQGFLSGTEKEDKVRPQYSYEQLPISHGDTLSKVMTPDPELAMTDAELAAKNHQFNVKYTTTPFPLLHETYLMPEKNDSNKNYKKNKLSQKSSKEPALFSKIKNHHLLVKNMYISNHNPKKTDPLKNNGNLYYKTIEKDLEAYKKNFTENLKLTAADNTRTYKAKKKKYLRKLTGFKNVQRTNYYNIIERDLEAYYLKNKKQKIQNKTKPPPQMIKKPQGANDASFIFKNIVFPEISHPSNHPCNNKNPYYEIIEKDLEAYKIPKTKSVGRDFGNGPQSKNIVFTIKKNCIKREDTSDLYSKAIEKDLGFDRSSSCRRTIEEETKEDLLNDKNVLIVEETRYQILTYLSPHLSISNQNTPPLDSSCYNSHPYTNIFRGVNLKYDFRSAKDETSSQSHSKEKNNLKYNIDVSRRSEKHKSKQPKKILRKKNVPTSLGTTSSVLTDNNISKLDDPMFDDKKFCSSLSEKDIDKLPLSELLRRIRLQNRLENISECIEICESQLSSTVQSSSCPPRIPRSQPKIPKCLPKDPTEFCPATPCPCPKKKRKCKCPPPCGKPPDRRKCDFSSLSLTQIYNKNVTTARQNLEFFLEHPMGCIFGYPPSLFANQGETDAEDKKPLSEDVKRNIINLVETLRARKMLPGENMVFFKNTNPYEPWVPIPSWPFPKKEKRKRVIPVKEGCPIPKPGDSEEANMREKPCTGFPRRTFSLPQFYF